MTRNQRPFSVSLDRIISNLDFQTDEYEQDSRSDPIWTSVREEIEEQVPKTPSLASYYKKCILNHDTLEECLAHILAAKISKNELQPDSWFDILKEVMQSDEQI